MKGLLRKELYILRLYWKIYALYVIIFGATSVMAGEPSFFAAMSGVLVLSLPLSTFSMDEQCSWNRMALAMPLSRKQIVGSKYLMTLMLSGIALLLQMVMIAVIALIRKENIDLAEFFVSMFVSMLSVLIVMMFLLPFIFKYGSEKGRVIMMLAFALFFGFITALGIFAKNAGSSAGIPALSLALAAIAVTVAAVTLSYIASCRIYAKKEF